MPSLEPSMVPSVVPSVPPTYHVDTKILSKYRKKYLQVIVVPKKGRYQIRFAAALFGTQSKSRKELVFSKTVPFGDSEAFGKFVWLSLRKEVRKWDTTADAKQWWDTTSAVFKANVTNKYRERVKQKERRRRQRPQTISKMQVDSPLMSVGRSAVYSVPLPNFVELRTKKSRFDTVQAIRIVQRLNRTTRNAPTAYLYLPRPLVRDSSGAQFSLGTTNGVNPKWMEFVEMYLRYVVGRWKTFQEARNWTLNHIHNFITLINKLWSTAGGTVGANYRVWDTLPVDKEYIRKQYCC